MSGVKEAPVRWAGPSISADPAPTTAKLFMHGGSQAVRLPKAFRFDGKEVRIHKEGECVILEPVRHEAEWPKTDEEWKAFWAKIDEMRGPELIPYPPRDHVYWSDPE